MNQEKQSKIKNYQTTISTKMIGESNYPWRFFTKWHKWGLSKKHNLKTVNKRGAISKRLLLEELDNLIKYQPKSTIFPRAQMIWQIELACWIMSRKSLKN